MLPPTALYDSILGNLRFRFIRLDPLNGKNPQLSYLHIKSINHLGRERKKEYFMGDHFDKYPYQKPFSLITDYYKYRTENVPSLGGSVGLTSFWVVSGAT